MDPAAMRILHVTRETAGDRRFGIGRSLAPVAEALRARGHEVQWLTQDDLGPRARAAVPRIEAALRLAAGALFGDAGRALDRVWAERIGMGWLAAKVARLSRADVVHLHDPWLARTFRAAAHWHRLPRALRWGLSEHGHGSYAQATREEGLPCTPSLMRWLLRLEARVLRRADWVVCPTASGRAQLARDLGCLQPAPNWQVVPHARPGLALPPRAVARQTLGWAEAMPVVLSVGRHDAVKRIDVVVAACTRLARPLRLVLLGADGVAPALQAAAAASPGLVLEARRVDDVAPYVAAADVYLSASRNEAFGLANLEALAAGLPAVCTAVGGVPEVCGGACWLVAGGDDGLADRLAEATRLLLDNAPLRQALAEAARQRAALWPDADEVAGRYEAIYRGVA